jgi:type IV pilus assembly protein PilC
VTKTLEYDYSVRDRTGAMVKGRIKADSPAMVATKLKSMGYAPVSIKQANAGLKRDLNIPGMGNKVGLKDLAVMSRQFATMINSGLSLLRALTILEEQTECKPLAKVLTQVRSEVEGGRSLGPVPARPRPVPKPSAEHGSCRH